MIKNTDNRNRYFVAALGLLLLLFLIMLVYRQAVGFDFVSMDDPVYVTENTYVNRGFSVEGFKWAFDFGHDSGPYWMPATMISHMADCEFFGLDPSKHHVHNVVLHILNTALLFLFFFKATGDYGKSLFVSALFALHPLNVESVAWITGRKNLLSTFFFLCTLLSYLFYVRGKKLTGYIAVSFFYFLGLASKASVITLVFSLLLFDIWPFHRFLLEKKDNEVRFLFFHRRNIIPVLEKIPLFLITGLVLYLNFSRASFVDEATSIDRVGIDLRFANALTAYIKYMIQTAWPVNLSVHYPYPLSVSLFKSVFSFVVLIGISIAAILNFRKRPWFFVGWFFFTGNLVMVSGVIQGGLWPAHADRFMYVPGIGLFMLISWFGAEKLKGSAAWGAAMAFIVVLAALTPVRASDWKNSVTLFRKAVEVNPDDTVSVVNLAFALDKAGQSREALPFYEKIIERYPSYAEVHANMAVIYIETGNFEKAEYHFEKAVTENSGSVTLWYNKALFHMRNKEDDKAEECFNEVLSLKPDHLEALESLAGINIRKRRYDKALEMYKQALYFFPDSGISIRYNMACVYSLDSETDKAFSYINEIIAEGFDRQDLLMNDEQLDNIRRDKRFQDILTLMNSMKLR